MKNLFLLLTAVLLIAGCKPAEESKSEPAEESKSEQLGKEIAEKMRNPIEETRAISEKIQKTREIELPK